MPRTSAQLVRDLLQNLPDRASRPVYLCVRSYQSWLEAAIEELGAEPGPRQAVMVKHLAAAAEGSPAFSLPAWKAASQRSLHPVAQTGSLK